MMSVLASEGAMLVVEYLLSLAVMRAAATIHSHQVPVVELGAFRKVEVAVQAGDMATSGELNTLRRGRQTRQRIQENKRKMQGFEQTIAT